MSSKFIVSNRVHDPPRDFTSVPACTYIDSSGQEFIDMESQFLNMRMPPLWKTAHSFLTEKVDSGTKRTGVIANSIRSWRKSSSSQILTTKTANVNRSLPGSSPLIRPTPPGIHTPAFVTVRVSTKIS